MQALRVKEGRGDMAKAKELPVNEDVLKWARTTAGLSIPQVAQELGVNTEYIFEIESGRKISKTLANELAKLYRRPLTVLFLPEPPVEEKIPTDYRILPNRKQLIGPETAHALREARRLQEVLSDLVEDPSAVSVFQKLPVEYNDNPADIGSKIREIVGVDFIDQNNWPSPAYAFRAWRAKLQRLGINIFVGDFPREEVRGFSLWNQELVPVIVVSRNEAPAAQIFTLFHELGHILLRSDAMCLKKEDETLLGTIEAWCNRVAAATLVPEDILRRVLTKYGHISIEGWEIDDLYEMASMFKVSRHVIAIRLEQIGCAHKGYYNRIKGLLDMDDYATRVLPRKGEEYRRNVPKERLAEVGFTTVTTILNACKEAMLSTMETADLLRLRPSKFSQLLDLASAQSKRYG